LRKGETVNFTSEDWNNRFGRQAGWTKPIRSYLFKQVNSDPRWRLLEVGCGTGVLLSELNELGFWDTHGLDISAQFLEMAMRNNNKPKFTQGDALALPYPTASFDLAFCHFVLLWVVDPTRVVQEMARVTRPGKPVLALAEPDYGARIDFPEPFQALGRLQTMALEKQGAETNMGRKLASVFSKAGLQSIETGILGGQWSGLPSPEDFISEWRVLRSDFEFLASESPLSERDLQQLQDIDLQSRKRGERVLFVPTFYALGFSPKR
jgi:ubiquinone/menaquinone biosynthesis C-methylase UbiE